MRPFWLVLAVAIVLLASPHCLGQCVRSRGGQGNFVVCGSDVETSRAVAEAAEEARKTWALRWFGRELPDWSRPANITARPTSSTSGGGATSFAFNNGEVFGWQGKWEGTRSALVNDVVPHEVTHMLLASWFRRPVVRWADEGCAMLAESETGKTNPRGMPMRWEPLRQFLNRQQYPRDIGSMYSQALLLTEWIAWQRTYRAMPALIESHFETKSWDAAFTALLGLNVAQIEPLVIAWARVNRPIPPGGRQGLYRWTGTGWAPWEGTNATLAAWIATDPKVPIRPALASRSAQGPLWDWMQAGQPAQSVPGVVPASSTPGPTWEPPPVLPGPGEAAQPLVPVTPVEPQTESLLGRVLGAITGVSEKADQLDKKLDATTAEVKATAIAAAEDTREGLLSKIKTYGGWGLGITLAWFSLGPYGVIGFVFKKTFGYIVKELRERSETGKPTDWEEMAARTQNKVDDLISIPTAVLAKQIDRLTEWGKSIEEKIDNLGKQPAPEKPA